MIKRIVKDKFADKDNLLLLVILILGSILRFYRYNSWSFTNDELSALSRTNYNSFLEMVNKGIITDVHPALTQIFEYIWVLFFDPSTIRIPFVLFGILTIYFAYKTASKWMGNFSALFVAAFIAVSEYFIQYSQIARPYSLGCFLVLLFAYYWSDYLQGNRAIKVSIGLIISASLAIMTHYFASLTIILLLGIGYFIEKIKFRKKYLVKIAVIVLCCLPHLYITIPHIKMGGLAGWLAAPEPTFILNLLDHVSNDFYLFQIVVLAAILLPPVYFRSKFIGFIKPWWGLTTFATCLLVGYLYSNYINPILQLSSLIFSLPLLLIFLFSYARYQNNRLMGFLFLILILVSGTYAVVFKNDFYHSKKFADFKGVSQQVELFYDSLGNKNVSIFMNANYPSYFQYYFDLHEFKPEIDKKVIEDYLDVAEIQRSLQESKKEYVIIAWANKFMPYEVHEIVKQHYPMRFYHKHYFNSEFTVYKKSPVDRKMLFDKTHTLENPIEDWDANWKKRDSNKYFSENHSLYIDSDSEYSMTYRTTVGNIFNANSRFLTIALQVKMDTISDCKIVVSVEQDGEQIEWRGFDIQNFYQKNKWFQPLFVFERKKEFKNEDKITIYLWNPGKSKLWVDDFSLRVYEDSNYDYYDHYPE